MSENESPFSSPKKPELVSDIDAMVEQLQAEVHVDRLSITGLFKRVKNRILHLEKKVYYDTLMDTYSRDYFDDEIRPQLERLYTGSERRAGQPTDYLLGFGDIDGLKLVNDTQGHEAGDDMLRSVADRVKSIMRPEDLVVRYGNKADEILIILPMFGDYSGKYEIITDLIDRRINEGDASISFGFAAMSDNESLDSTIASAEAKMRVKKMQKKNRE